MNFLGEDPTKGFRYYTKSIELFRHYELSPTIVAETWAAMGFVFLNQKKNMAAYEMLAKAQNANPDLPEAWLGMAWCAEQAGHDLEAMDLCRHTCLLSLLRHPMRRYAEWVLWMLYEKTIDTGDRYDLIVRSEAVPTAVDYLLRYTRNRIILKFCETDKNKSIKEYLFDLMFYRNLFFSRCVA